MTAIRFWIADSAMHYVLNPYVEDEVMYVLPIDRERRRGILNPKVTIQTIERVHVSIHQGRRQEFADTDKIVDFVRALAQLRFLAIEAEKIWSPIGYR